MNNSRPDIHGPLAVDKLNCPQTVEEGSVINKLGKHFNWLFNIDNFMK